MGEVFLAYDRRLANEVALKRLHPQLSSSPELRDSLTKEARMMARLSDGAIVRLFDLTEFSGGLYVILEYVCGPSLKDVIRSGHKVSPLELAHLSEQICRGLTVAHQAGVIHRDLKPSNLLLALEGEERAAFLKSGRLPADLRTTKVKITDFGIAKAIADSGSTLTNAFGGTPGYMAPEQFRGEAASPATDIYALGVSTCELLTGKAPSTPPYSIDGVHAAVTEVIAKAMSPAARDRFQSAASFHEALCNGIEGRSPKRPALKPARPGLGRKQILALAMLVIGFAGGLIALLPRHAPRTRQVIQPALNFSGETIEWHSPPRVEEVPPVVEEARGRLPETRLDGPQKPKVKWTISLKVIGMKIAAVGVDGTVYLRTMEGICAVRDGKLIWAYKAGTTGASDVRIDDDGRIWYRSMDATYCLNRDGKGGRLPRSFPEPSARGGMAARCVMNHTLSARNFRLDLDAECTRAGAVTSPEGRVYVATDLPEIMAVSAGGAIEWKRTAPCNASEILATLPNQIVYSCEDRSLHGLTGGNEVWKKTADGMLYSDMLVDRSGAVYYGDYGRESGVIHVHAIDSRGKDLWTIDMERASVSNMALDAKRRLYVAGSFANSRLVCLGD